MKLCLSGDGQYFNLNNILTGLKIDFEQFQRMCVLAGCDNLKNIRGLGIITAYKLIVAKDDYICCLLKLLEHAIHQQDKRYLKKHMSALTHTTD